MKQVFLLIIGFLLFIEAFSQSGNTTFAFARNSKENIRSNKVIREEVFSYTFKKSDVKDSVLNIIYYYDTLGDLVVETLAKTKNYRESTTRFSYTYNASGRLHRQIENKQDLKMISIYEFDYDSLGNEINMYDYDKDTTRLMIEQKTYNKNNQVIQLATKLDNNNFYISRSYQYNSNNGLSKTVAYNNKGEVIYSDIYEYDKKLNKKTVYLENGNGKHKTEEYFYNDDKQCIKMYSSFRGTTYIGPDSPEYYQLNQVTENIYNQDKTLFESNVYLNGKKIQTNRHFYFKD